MLTIEILGVTLIVLILIVCGDKGSKSIITTVMNAVILLIAIYLIYKGMHPIIVTVVFCIIITSIVLFYQNEIDSKSKASFISVLIVIAIVVPLVYIVANSANSEGFNSEQYEITDSNGYTRNINISMLSLQISTMLIALMGTVIDTAVAVTSSIYEIKTTGQVSSTKELATAGFTVGKSIMSTSIHTIFYIYMAEYLTLMIQYVNDYTFIKLINSESFVHELIAVSISGIGCCLVIPVAIYVSCHTKHNI